MSSESLKLTCHEITCDYTLCLAIYYDKVKHLMTRITCHGAGGDLTVQSGVSAEKELLSGLSTGIESTADLDTSE